MSINDTPHGSSRTKTISFWGGCQLLINNLAGPALVLIPALFQQSGFIPVVIMMLIASILSGYCSWFVTESLKYIPGNCNYNLESEYTSLIDRFCGSNKYVKNLMFIFYLLSLITLLMSNIIESAQVTDIAIRDIFGCAHGLQLYPTLTTQCGKHVDDAATPFDNNSIVISVGYCILAFICLLCSNKNLDDNIVLQWIANIGLTFLIVIWLIIFRDSDEYDLNSIGMFSWNFNNVAGIVLFNFAFIVTIPSWVNEKKDNVSVKKTLQYSLVFILIVFLIIGIFGAFAYNYSEFDTLFTKLDEKGGNWGKGTVYAFPIIQNVTSIPVFSIIIRYNLVGDYKWSRTNANIVAILLPWVLSVFLYSGEGFEELCDWAGILISSVVNFLLPPLIYMKAVELRHQRMQKQEITLTKITTQGNTPNGKNDDTPGGETLSKETNKKNDENDKTGDSDRIGGTAYDDSDDEDETVPMVGGSNDNRNGDNQVRQNMISFTTENFDSEQDFVKHEKRNIKCAKVTFLIGITLCLVAAIDKTGFEFGYTTKAQDTNTDGLGNKWDTKYTQHLANQTVSGSLN